VEVKLNFLKGNHIFKIKKKKLINLF